MWPDVIVLSEPLIDHDLSLFGCGKPLGIENLVTERAVEAFIVSILPWRAWIDADWFDANLIEPGLEVFSYELRTVI